MNKQKINVSKHFKKWMFTNLSIKEQTINKYVGAVKVIDKFIDLNSPSIFIKFSQDIKHQIESLSVFKYRNNRGNRMYSAALNHYYNFYLDNDNLFEKTNIKDSTSQIHQIEDINAFLNLTVTQLSKQLGVSNSTTAVTRELTNRFLMDSNFRSVRRNLKGTVQESIPLDNINFETIINEDFNDSSLYNRFNKGFHFLIYDQLTSSANSLILRYALLWKPNEGSIQDNVYPFWLNVKNVVSNGVEINKVKRGNGYVNKNNLPKAKGNPTLHVRPKAKNAADTTPLPDGRHITKQAYWINNTYIKKIVTVFEEEILSTKNSLCDYKSTLIKYPILKVIYTRNKYIEKIKSNNKELKNILTNDYELKYGYYINKAFDSITEAIKYDILNLDFLHLNNYQYKDYNILNNVLAELKQSFQVVEVDKDVFITYKTLENGKVSLKDITNYIKQVLEFSIEQHNYFNINILRHNNVTSKMFDLGFKDIFYEEILKNSGKFNYQTYRGNVLFTTNKVEEKVFTDLVTKCILNSEELYRHEISKILKDDFNIINLNLTDILSFYDSKQGIHYCPKMDMFFKSKNRYLDIILRRNSNDTIRT